MNQLYLSVFVHYFKNYPVWKTLTKNNLYVTRILVLFQGAFQAGLLFLPIVPFLMVKYKQYDLKDLNDNTQLVKLPFNTFQHRQSAHYVEINQRYMFLMSEEYKERYNQIADERSQEGRKERLMKYANPSYAYKEPRNLNW